MSAGLQITGWPAHDSAISSVLFGPDETSIFSLGTDGKASSLTLSSSVNNAFYYSSLHPYKLSLLSPDFFINLC